MIHWIVQYVSTKYSVFFVMFIVHICWLLTFAARDIENLINTYNLHIRTMRLNSDFLNTTTTIHRWWSIWRMKSWILYSKFITLNFRFGFLQTRPQWTSTCHNHWPVCKCWTIWHWCHCCCYWSNTSSIRFPRWYSHWNSFIYRN